jgi:hypothetical protein
MGKVSFALGLGAGYVLGARAGRARYEQIQHAAASLAEKPQVQEAVGKVRDSLPAPLQNAVDGIVPKSSSGGSGGGSPSSTPSSTASPAAAAGGSFPLADDGEPGVAQTFSAFTEPTADEPETGHPR